MPIIVGLPIGGGGLPAPADSKIRPGSLAIAFAADVPTISKSVTFTAPSALSFAVTAPTITSPGGFPSIGTTIVWRYRAESEGLADGTALSQLTDQSGNSRHATQGTAANKPTLKTGILNGKAVYRFDGVNDFVTVTVDLTGTSTITLYLVANTSDSGAQKVLVENTADYNSSTTGFVVLKDPANVVFGGVKGNVDYSYFITTGTLGATSRLIRVLLDKTLATNEATVELNHSTAGSRVNANNTNAFGNNISYIGSRAGTSFYWPGDIAELVLLAGDPSSGDKTALDAYFLAEYGV